MIGRSGAGLTGVNQVVMMEAIELQITIRRPHVLATERTGTSPTLPRQILQSTCLRLLDTLTATLHTDETETDKVTTTLEVTVTQKVTMTKKVPVTKEVMIIEEVAITDE
jgi:hypothetical protein